MPIGTGNPNPVIPDTTGRTFEYECPFCGEKFGALPYHLPKCSEGGEV